jgi:hypothetical protein
MSNSSRTGLEDYAVAKFILMTTENTLSVAKSKMSKSKYNVVTQMIFVTNTEPILCVCMKCS